MGMNIATPLIMAIILHKISGQKYRNPESIPSITAGITFPQ